MEKRYRNKIIIISIIKDTKMYYKFVILIK